MNVPAYCRELEAYLCRKNDGHLIRIVGPSFDVVSRWAADGVPVKVAMSGIDRYFERYYRKGPRRRPVKIDFCEADVLDVFDEWRRATGLTPAASGDPGLGGGSAAPVRKKGPSLPEHLERALTRLSSLRVTGVLGEEADSVVDRVSAELDTARSRTAGVRGEERRATLERLAALDAELMALVTSSADPALVSGARVEAEGELNTFRTTMDLDAFARSVELAATTVLRERLRIPVLTFR
jgi:hypothetical protein